MRVFVAVLSALVLATFGTAQDPQAGKPQGQEQKSAEKEAGEEPAGQREKGAEPLQAAEALRLVLRERAARGRVDPVVLPLNLNVQQNRAQLIPLLRGVTFVHSAAPIDSYTAEVPAAQESLAEIEQALQAARTAGDEKAVLEALDRMERAIMKTRAAVHDAAQAKAPPAVESGGKDK